MNPSTAFRIELPKTDETDVSTRDNRVSVQNISEKIAQMHLLSKSEWLNGKEQTLSKIVK